MALSTKAAALEPPLAAPARGHVRPSIVVAATMLLITVLLIVVVPFLPTYEPFAQDLTSRGLAAFSDTGRILGTDELGRDLLSRMSLGARISLLIAIPAVALSLTIGVTLGLAAGYFGRWVDQVVAFVIDIHLAIPLMLILISVSFALTPSIPVLIVALGVWGWMGYARVSRAIGIQLRERDFVWAPRIQGAGHLWVLRKHIWPEVIAPLAILVPYELSLVLLIEAALSFIGLGVQAPTPSLGGLVRGGQDYLRLYPGITLWPGLALFLVVGGLQVSSQLLTRDRRLRRQP